MIIVFHRDTGRAESSTETWASVANPLPSHLDAVDVGATSWDTHMWDEVSRSMVPRPALIRTQVTVAEFRSRFTDEELIGIEMAAEGPDAFTRAVLRVQKDTLNSVQVNGVDLTDPRTAKGLDALISLGLLAPERKSALLSPMGA